MQHPRLLVRLQLQLLVWVRTSRLLVAGRIEFAAERLGQLALLGPIQRGLQGSIGLSSCHTLILLVPYHNKYMSARRN